ncbi:MAG: cyclic nucleotide-binding domain-containing protein [Lentisphaeraceae bacterium]|nr:cyclic nucleotide-binding domain-containing protein [Lentisphaeraceae bacterium]
MPLKNIASLELPIVEFEAGSIILEEGELTSSIYILIEGKVRIISEDEELLTDNTIG